MEIWENRQLEDLEGELWLPIKGYEGLYEISNMGRVKTLPRKTKTKIVQSPKILRIMKRHSGYIQAKLCKESRHIGPIVSRLVAEAFCNPPSYKWVANHINCIRWDNRASNLECITQSQNVRYSFKKGNKSQRGSINNQAKINMNIATALREYREKNDHLSRKEIAKDFGLSINIVKDVLNGKSWNY